MTIEVTEEEKETYNRFLKFVQEKRNKPFVPRTNFSRMSENNIRHLRDVCDIFRTFPHFKRKEFFEAPYKIFDQKDKYYNLDFYASTKGFRTAARYFSVLENKKPSEKKDFMYSSMKYILKYCEEKKISSISQYINCNSGYFKTFMLHMKDHRIAYHTMFVFPQMYQHIYNLAEDDIELLFGNINLNVLRQKYASDAEGKKFCEILGKKLSQKLA